MGNFCNKDDSNDYSLLHDSKNIDNMEALISKLTIGIRNLENDVTNLQEENTRLKKINQSLLTRVVEKDNM